MGGCKCSYRNCTAKSNGRLHLFHYPVFDRPRCHKWLVNGHRQDFLNLKVSQLKNRVVCQHHFKDDDFMNINKEKLKPNAVPTLNGPHCDPSEWGEDEVNDKFDQIDIEDIENDLYMNFDKKDCFQHKYGNFLANSDLVDLDFTQPKKETKKNNHVLGVNQNPAPSDVPPVPKKRKQILNLEELTRSPKKLTMNSYKSPKISKVEIISDEIVDVKNILPDPPVLAPVKCDSVLPLPNRLDTNSIKANTIKEPPQKHPPKTTGTNTFIISSEFNPNQSMLSNEVVTFDFNELTPVQNITHISVPNEKTHSKVFEIPVIMPDNLQVINVVPKDDPSNINFNKRPIVNNGQVKIHELPDQTVTTAVKQVQKSEQDRPLSYEKISLLKNKMCSKRLSAIEQKRNFNKRLTDLISSQLVQENDTHSNVPNNIKSPSNLRASEKESNNTKTKQLPNTVKSHLSQGQSLLCENNYSIAVLEHKMQKMEQMFLQKMEQNTRMVLDLKRSLENKLPATYKAVTTQTALDEESHKKYLYHEISKYLSPEANNFIFEELFINVFDPKRPKLRR